MDAGDIIIDGGNTYYRDDIERAKAYEPQGVHYVDVGTSGGVFGLERGLLPDDRRRGRHRAPPRPDLRGARPRVAAAPRTPGRERRPTSTAEDGYLHCGPAGAGHFVKMVHNGIEYGLMAAYAEGLNVLRHANVGNEQRDGRCRDHAAARARVLPLRHRHAEVAEVWRRGSVVGSWLLDLTAAALLADPDLEGFPGRVSDSGEGRWTMLAAVDEGVPAHVLSAALFDRFESRGEAEFADRVLSAMRKEFGGHAEKASG